MRWRTHERVFLRLASHLRTPQNAIRCCCLTCQSSAECQSTRCLIQALLHDCLERQSEGLPAVRECLRSSCLRREYILDARLGFRHKLWTQLLHELQSRTCNFKYFAAIFAEFLHFKDDVPRYFYSVRTTKVASFSAILADALCSDTRMKPSPFGSPQQSCGNLFLHVAHA